MGTLEKLGGPPPALKGMKVFTIFYQIYKMKWSKSEEKIEIRESMRSWGPPDSVPPPPIANVAASLVSSTERGQAGRRNINHYSYRRRKVTQFRFRSFCQSCKTGRFKAGLPTFLALHKPFRWMPGFAGMTIKSCDFMPVWVVCRHSFRPHP